MVSSGPDDLEEVLSQLIALAGSGLVCANRVSAGLVHALPESLVETVVVFARKYI